MSRLVVDWTRCDGRGLCAELFPEILEEDPWGYPVARDGRSSPADPRGSIAVPAALRAHAGRAVAACPLLALRLD